MAEKDTNADTTGEGTVNNDVDAKGNESDIKKTETKTFTQDELNQIVKQRLAENTAKVKRDVEKSYEGKIVLTEDELNTKLKDASDSSVETYKRETALTNKKAEFKTKGLTDAQLEVIAEKAEKVEDFEKVATELFGAMLKKDAPNINPGNSTDNNKGTELDETDLLLQRMQDRNKKR